MLADKIVVLIAACILSGCAQQPAYVPVEIKPPVAPVPAECLRPVPSDLPPVPQIGGSTADAARVNAHWAKHDIEQRKAYRPVRDAARVCQKYAQEVAR